MKFIKTIVLLFIIIIADTGMAKADTAAATGTLIVHVSIGDTGRPLYGALVTASSTIRGAGNIVKGTTGKNGQCILGGMTSGTYTLKVSSKGYAQHTQTIDITGGEAALYTVNLYNELVYNVHAKALAMDTRSSSSSTKIPEQTIATMAGTNNLSKILYTVPGAVQGPFGEVHFRGAHTEITYRIDGIEIPSAVSGSFSDILDPQDIESIDVLTGGYPAEYGNSLAGVVNIQTKHTSGKEVGFSAGNYTTNDINFDVAGSKGAFDYHLSGISYHTDRGIDTPVVNPIHDELFKNALLGDFGYVVDNDDKLALLLSGNISQYQIPNTYQQQALGVNDNQGESNDFEVLIWRHDFLNDSNLSLSQYRRGSTLSSLGSPADLDGGTVTTPAYLNNVIESNLDYGTQADYTNNTVQHNQIKAGIRYKYMINNQSFYLEENPATYQSFFDAHVDRAYEGSGYVQDEFHLRPVTVDAGLRYDYLDQYITADQVSPRLGIAIQPFATNTIHGYYGQFFQPAPFESIRINSIPMFQNQNMSIPLKPERDDYFEAGDRQLIGPYLLAKLTWYYKLMTDVIDYNQLLSSNIYVPYNIQSGYTRGIEFSLKSSEAYGLSGEFNIAWEKSQGKGAITGGLFTVQPLPPGYFYFDHDQTYTSSLTINYRYAAFWSMLDIEYGSGLPYGYDPVTGNVNFLRVPPHTIPDLYLGYNFGRGFYLGKSAIELDIANILNTSYLINQQNGFNNTHWGSPRTILLLFKKYF
ncbi:MAG: TonB-dependent receptor [Deltaproteobacteria bacterium]|nr:TonB-dependent receptor [Deltaproteobacteria bacterium]MCL5277396.1 TonB-dependent receptor [Deltaproteobacteria bacterium]